MIRNNNAQFNGPFNLPLFFWAERREEHLALLTLTERHLVRYCGLKPHYARTLATIYGLGESYDR